MSSTGASPLSNYRARRRWEINELMHDLNGLKLDPALKESLRQRLDLLLHEVETSRRDDRQLVSKIRDARGQVRSLDRAQPAKHQKPGV